MSGHENGHDPMSAIVAIGEKHAEGIPDRSRFNPTRVYVEEVARILSGEKEDLPDNIEQRIERVVADRLEPIVAQLDEIQSEMKRRRGGRPKKAG